MNTPDGWIKTSDRLPSESDFPFWSVSKHGAVGLWDDEDEIKHFEAGFITHWQPAVLPAPPAKELTQREKDKEALKQWSLNALGAEFELSSESEAWHAALAYRDGQNAEDLENGRNGFWSIQGGNMCAAISSLRRRCGLDQ